ncbi:MAG: mechanosensitive ion channel family protein [Cytophagales bacterium]|nr:MAG: mechanosensitive ion channel family protein [Cytophagales bacterium]
MDYLQNWFSHIDSPLFANIGILLVVLYALRKIAKYIVGKKLITTDDNDGKTRLRFFKNAIDFSFFLIGFIALFNIVPSLKSVSMGVFAGAGLFVALVGLAGQRAVANIIAGFFIIGFKSFRVGDFIYVGSYYGIVEDVNLRHTTIRNLENKRIIIPNFNIATDTIINTTLHDEKVCKFIDIDICYEANIDKAIDIISTASGKHIDSLDVRTPEEIASGKPKVVVRVKSLDNAAVTLRAFVWCRDELTAIVMKQDLLKIIKESFDENNIGLAIPKNLVMFEKPNKV